MRMEVLLGEVARINLNERRKILIIEQWIFSSSCYLSFGFGTFFETFG